jgi:hypothetical protein
MAGARQQPAAQDVVGAEVTRRSAVRQLRTAALSWAWAGLPGEEFDAALEEAREALRAQSKVIAALKDKT